MPESAHPFDIVNPILIDTVVPSSVAAVSDPEAFPGKIVVKLQTVDPDGTTLRTFLFPLDLLDATILRESLSKQLASAS